MQASPTGEDICCMVLRGVEKAASCECALDSILPVSKTGLKIKRRTVNKVRNFIFMFVTHSILAQHWQAS